MSLLKWLSGKRAESKPRIRVCMECGMAVSEHKEWCAILRGQMERGTRAQAPSSEAAPSTPGES